MSKYIPSYNINIPNGGEQKSVIVGPSDSIYSSYSGDFISHGPLLKGTPNDAPHSHPNYGKPFHVIEYNPCNNSYMAHEFK